MKNKTSFLRQRVNPVLGLLFIVTLSFLFYTFFTNKLLEILSYQEQQALSTPQVRIKPKISPTLTIDKTSNWNIYNNVKFNYEIKYPFDWEISKQKLTADQLSYLNQLSHITFIDRTYKNFQPSITIEIYPNSKNYDLEKWAVNFKIANLAEPSINLAKIIGDALLGEQPAKKFSIFTWDLPEDNALATINNGKVYFIRYPNFKSFGPEDSNYNYYLDENQTIQTILSTFKFLNQN